MLIFGYNPDNDKLLKYYEKTSDNMKYFFLMFYFNILATSYIIGLMDGECLQD